MTKILEEKEGETMTKYGLVKTLKDGEHEIKLVGNAMTFILYKSYFGRDLLNDIIVFAKKSATIEMLAGIKDIGNPSEISEDNALALLQNMDDFEFDSEFVLNFIASLMATAMYPIKPDIAELIMQIPPHFIADQEVITELIEFLSLFVKQKKQ